MTSTSQLDKATSRLAIPLGLADGHPNWQVVLENLSNSSNNTLWQVEAEHATASKTFFEDMSEAQLESLLSAFAAQYLPQLIAAFLDTAPVIQDESPWSRALVALLDNIVC